MATYYTKVVVVDVVLIVDIREYIKSTDCVAVVLKLKSLYILTIKLLVLDVYMLIDVRVRYVELIRDMLIFST